ncbi:hypothetical protein AncyloWKF20_01190 [Ancylobacter sp. WKF20]|uniref:hypothetical protein n=1 Tax=Ancylobacter sp. WKF20 TaxID=3039801 RepID=UPI002434117C|nr:hypothetical protein [Ancylobacter sp. WKF20]WGD30488.1 hypothetical protein AncyloWKF20_01190 [Ancylobacter sp. WKF20]
MAMNDDLPSKADTMPGASEADSTTSKVQAAVDTAQSYASDLGERGKNAYRSSNEAVASYVDPVPGMMLAAAAGFVAGCLWASGRRY